MLWRRFLGNSVVRGRDVKASRGVTTHLGEFRNLSWTDQQPEVRSCDRRIQQQHFDMKWLIIFDLECKPGNTSRQLLIVGSICPKVKRPCDPRSLTIPNGTKRARAPRPMSDNFENYRFVRGIRSLRRRP
jgi:hypothetical protein